jgi:hypothetical protein
MFWITPIQASTPGQAEIGLQSMEFQALTFRVELYDNGQLVQKWENIQLAPHQEWTVLIDTRNYPPGTDRLEAQLYRADQPEVIYRKVWLRDRVEGFQP